MRVPEAIVALACLALAAEVLVLTTPPEPAAAQEPAPAPREQALEEMLAPAGRKVGRSVVEVMGPGDRRLGYGLVVRERLVLLSGHVEHVGARLVGGGFALRGHSGQLHRASVVARDDEDGLLLVRASELSEPPVDLTSSRTPPRGAFVGSVGMDGSCVSAGVVSATGRTVSGQEELHPIPIPGLMGFRPDTSRTPVRYHPQVIQHDSRLSLSELGSPLVDSSGRLVGINVSNVLRGTSYAVPAARIRQVLPILAAGKDIAAKPRGFLGIQVEPAPISVLQSLGASGAVVVYDVLPGHAAQRSGLRPGDIILQVDEHPVLDPRALIQRVSAIRPGTRVTLAVVRNGRRISLPLEVGTPLAERR